MNSETLKKVPYLKPGTLLQVVYNIGRTAIKISRIGKFSEIYGEAFILVPHGLSKANIAYGGDIVGIATIIDISNIIEIIVLDETEAVLDKLLYLERNASQL